MLYSLVCLARQSTSSYETVLAMMKVCRCSLLTSTQRVYLSMNSHKALDHSSWLGPCMSSALSDYAILRAGDPLWRRP